MRAYATMLLAATLVLVFAPETGAQVTKPRNPPSGGRLPPPARISASQLPDGNIRVVWSPVENATKYGLIRSVPPTPAAAVALPNPSDTVYIDSDVKPGSTYYYVVKADNEERVGGLNAATVPVTAVAPGAALSGPGDTGTTAEADTTTKPDVTAPTNVLARAYPYMQATVSWDYRGAGVRFLLERIVGDRKTGWEQIRQRTGLDLWSCCSATDPHPPDQKTVRYRLTAVNNTPPYYRSSPAVSNTIFISKIKTEPPVLNDLDLVAGLDMRMPGDYTGNPSLLNTRWVSLDSSVVTIPLGGGYVAARRQGYTHIIATGMTRNGAIQSWIWRVTVRPARR